MSRLSWVQPLVDYLKNDSTLTSILRSQYIFLISKYVGITEDNQYSPAVWIMPLEAETLSKQRIVGDCGYYFKQKVMIASVVRNVFDTRNNFGWSHSSTPSTYIGGYPEADALEALVVDSISRFNTSIHSKNPKYSFEPFQLVQLSPPDLHNGHLILPMIYETKITV